MKTVYITIIVNACEPTANQAIGIIHAQRRHIGIISHDADFSATNYEAYREFKMQKNALN